MAPPSPVPTAVRSSNWSRRSPRAEPGPPAPTLAPLVVAGGSLYGVTSQGGAYAPQGGALYEVRPPASPGGAWAESVLYSFGAPGAATGNPVGSVVAGPSGSCYALGQAGGAYGGGALNLLQPPASPGGPWTETLLYSFPSGLASGPLNCLVAGPNGVLYGTLAYGGNASAPIGEVFQLTPPAAPGGTWAMSVLHSFGGADDDVGNPAALTVAPDGTIYGAAYGTDFFQGASASVVFQLAPPTSSADAWTYTVLADLGYKRQIHTPLVLISGNLYGAITAGNGGKVIELQPPSAPGGAWTMTTLHTFTNGQVPIGNLVADAKGTIFGTTAAAPGQPLGGTVYAITTK